jgi:CRP-like cAMP-binding protein
MNHSLTAKDLELLSTSPILAKLNRPALKSIVKPATFCNVKRGEFLFHQGDPATYFYLLIDGQTRLSQIADDGRQVIFHYFGPGDVMGLMAALGDVSYPVSAEASVDVAALRWNRETAVSLMEQYPQLAINAAKMVAVRFWELQNRFRELATERVEQRLAHTVLRLTEYSNGQVGAVTSPSLYISRQALAEMTGTTVFSVSRICSEWEQRGILATGREQITLLNRDGLEAIAEKRSAF